MHLEIAKQNGEIDILSHQETRSQKRWGHVWISEPQSKDPNNIKGFSASPTLNASVFIVTDCLSIRLHKDMVLKSTGLEIYHRYNLRRH